MYPQALQLSAEAESWEVHYNTFLSITDYIWQGENIYDSGF